jgi:hypothetical protein
MPGLNLHDNELPQGVKKMKNPLMHGGAISWRAGYLRILVTAAAALALLTGCPNIPRSGQLEKPVLSSLEIPTATGSWSTYSTSVPPSEVLPTRGRVLRLRFYAPVGSSFGITLRSPDGTETMLPQNSGAALPAENGFFEIINVNTAVNPPLYLAHIRSPLSLMDPANFDVLVVNKSLRTDVTDSDALVVRLGQRKVFTVTVQVSGNGHVTSNPPGIQCGTSSSGAAMSPCSYEFGNGPVSLNPAANDLNTTKFISWGGNCDPAVQVCQFTLNGMAPINATATFGPRSTAIPVSQCPVAPLLPGLKWIDIPNCNTGNIAGNPSSNPKASCDANGYFCCKDGPLNSNSPRCGAQKIEFPPDCMHKAPKGTLRQPGGCYEVDS